ncbi:MAG TPA: TonB-dependent receptor [Burkholderiales bacterium]|nr:TonB-dependent receptor [Burkholderiales bacterium]
MTARTLSAAWLAVLACAALPGHTQDTQTPQTSTSETKAPQTPVVEVIGTSPVPGLGVSKEMVPGNVQTVNDKLINELKPLNLNSLLEESVGSVNLSNFQGNPFQPDVNYRGFTASPLLGTPQGLSVYLDNVRMNQPFGDVVSWDLIPMNAISRVDVIPGSNPLYGLNTLGGAIALRTKDGFLDPGGYVEASGGSWGRWNTWAELGGNNGKIGAYINANYFQENGWRDLSPSKVGQLFAKLSMRAEYTDVDFSLAYAKSNLTGNGGTPVNLLQQSYSSVFTVPDQTQNENIQLNLAGTHWLDDKNQIGGAVYYRKTRTSTTNGDVFDDFPDTAFDGSNTDPGALNPGTGTPFSPTDGYAPTGVFNNTSTNQQGTGLALQYTHLSTSNRFTLGATYDYSTVDYSQTTQIAWLNDQRVAQLPPMPFVDFFNGAAPANSISGQYQTASAFFTDTWSIIPTVHLTLSGRYNWTQVTSNLTHNLNAEDMTEYDGTNDFQTTNETFTYSQFNPAAGVTWNARPDLTGYVNYSQGSRVPSPIELGCANPNAPCTIPSALTGDPFLPEVIARTGEVGARGILRNQMAWNVALFRTDTTNDILFVSSPTNPQQGYFSSFGKTRRQGLELGLSGQIDRFSWQSAYTYLNATFQSTSQLVNSANSSSDANGVYTVSPGDHIPGLPQNIFKLNVNYQLTRGWSIGGLLYAQSWQYVRGNENNLDQAGGTGGDGLPNVDAGTVPGFAVVNLRTRYQFDNGLALFAEIDNIFNRKYYTAGSLNVNPFVAGAGGTVGSNGFNYNSAGWQNATLYTPGAPIGIWVGISYGWGGKKSTND